MNTLKFPEYSHENQLVIRAINVDPLIMEGASDFISFISLSFVSEETDSYGSVFTQGNFPIEFEVDAKLLLI